MGPRGTGLARQLPAGGLGALARNLTSVAVVALAVAAGLVVVVGPVVVVASADPAGATPGAAAVEVDGERVEPPAPEVTVVMTDLAPFVEDDNGRADGFYAEIWDHVADDLGVSYEVLWVDSFGEVLAAVADGRAEVAVAPLAPTAEREASFDFSSAVISSGPQLGYHQRIERSSPLIGALLSWPVLRILLASVAGLTVLAHVIWLVERSHPESHFHRRYPRGVWDGFWWGAVTVTTVGYGDKAPQSNRGRVVALVGMLLSLFMVGAFVSQVTAILETTRTGPPFTDLETLGDRPVAAVEGSSFAAFMTVEGATVVTYPSQTAAFEAAEAGEVDVVITNPFTLDALGDRYGLAAAGPVLYEEFETFGMAQGSPWREPINQSLARLQAEGEVAEIVDRWQG